MATAPSHKNGVSLLKGLRDQITTNTGINNFDRDSKTRAISDTVTQELISLREEAISAFEATQLSNATGPDLIEFGRSRGIPKREITFASVDETERSLAFYVEVGTFGTINGGLPITVPQGTIILSAPNNNELGSTVKYKLTRDVVLQTGEALKYVSARAETGGAISNLGRGTLRTHQFTNYADSGNNTLRVINFYPIMNGRNVESDDQYRFRISQHYNRLHQNSDIRILLTSLDVPGVLDVKPITGFFGIGTVGVVVLGADNQATTSLVSEVQARLTRFQGPGLRLTAVPASSVVLDLELEVQSPNGGTQQERSLVTAQIRRALLDYLRSTKIGGTLRFEDLALSVQSRTQSLIKLGARGTAGKLFKNVFIRRGFSNGALSERERLIGSTIPLAEDEYADLGTLDITFV